MAAITKIWVDDDRLWVETDDGNDPCTYIVDPDQHYFDLLDAANDEKPSGTLVWTKEGEVTTPTVVVFRTRPQPRYRDEGGNYHYEVPNA